MDEEPTLSDEAAGCGGRVSSLLPFVDVGRQIPIAYQGAAFREDQLTNELPTIWGRGLSEDFQSCDDLRNTDDGIRWITRIRQWPEIS